MTRDDDPSGPSGPPEPPESAPRRGRFHPLRTAYGEGGPGLAPDPRATLANERTFLAWQRTALSLMAAGVGVKAFITVHLLGRDALAVLLLAAGAVCAVTSLGRWALVQRALRTGRPLPALRGAPVLALLLGLIGLTVAVLVVVG